MDNNTNSVYTVGLMKELKKDPRWGGLPPVGENPIPKPSQFVLELILLMILEIGIWGVYRYITAPILGTAFSYRFFFFHIIMAPLIHLTPIFLYWRFRLGERGLPFMFTRKNLFSAVLVALIAVVILYILYQVIQAGLLSAVGIATIEDTFIYVQWLNAEPAWFILMMFTFFFVVGPVEELQYRSFLQDQINRVYSPWVGIGLSAFFFGAGHLPIYFILYQLAPEIAFITMIYASTFGLLMSLFYHWSRNIIGPIILHGFWDWQLSVYAIFFVFNYPSAPEPLLASFIFWLSAAISMTIIVIFFYFAYHLWWKSERPAGSLGFRVPMISSLFKPDGGIAGIGRKLKKRPIINKTRNIDNRKYSIPFTIFITSMIILFFCGGVMGVSALVGHSELTKGSHVGSGQNGVKDDLQEITLEYSISGYTSEHGSSDNLLDIPEKNQERLIKIEAKLNWRDEESSFIGGTNQPDEFKVSILAPNDELEESGFSSSGTTTVSFILPDHNSRDFINNYMGEWLVVVEAGDCGDDQSVMGIRTSVDNGNEWTLDYSYSYMGVQQV
jgi:membrane protease YdiL (CAAX protease family)